YIPMFTLVLPLTVPAAHEIYTLSLHDAFRSPVFEELKQRSERERLLVPRVVYGYFKCQSSGNDLIIYDDDGGAERTRFTFPRQPDRKSTRLNSSHVAISYAVFCLKKKKLNSQRRDRGVRASGRQVRGPRAPEDASGGRAARRSEECRRCDTS